MKKRVSILFGLCILLCLCNIQFCFAIENSNSMKVEVNTIDDLYSGLSNQIYRHQESVTYNINSYDIFYRLKEIIENYDYHYCDEEPIKSGCYLIHYVKEFQYTTMDWRSTKGSRYEVEIKLSYYYSSDEMNHYFNEMQQVASDLKNTSDYNSVRAVHNYIVENVDYDYNYKNYIDMEGFRDGEMVCNGYSMATFLLLSYMDIPVRMISGTAENSDGEIIGHGWNIVNLDGKWYNIDATWDDMGRFGYSYEYFLKGMNEFDNHVCDEEIVESYRNLVSNESYTLPVLDRCLNGINFISISEVLVVIIGLMIYLISAIIKKRNKESDGA